MKTPVRTPELAERESTPPVEIILPAPPSPILPAIQLPRKIELPPLPRVPLPEPPTLPEYFETVRKILVGFR